LKTSQNLEITRKFINALEEKKAIDITLIDIHDVAFFTDYFIICSGTSDRMLRSLVQAINETAKEVFNKKGRVIGIPSNGWIAVDLGYIVLHLFSPERRAYYDLEDLWSDGKILLKIS